MRPEPSVRLNMVSPLISGGDGEGEDVDAAAAPPLENGVAAEGRAHAVVLPTPALRRLSIFAAKNADVLDSIDVNPLLVLPEGEGAVALDGLIATK